MQFTLTIELGTEAVPNREALESALLTVRAELAFHVAQHFAKYPGRPMTFGDLRGRTVGQWEVTETPATEQPRFLSGGREIDAAGAAQALVPSVCIAGNPTVEGEPCDDIACVCRVPARRRSEADRLGTIEDALVNGYAVEDAPYTIEHLTAVLDVIVEAIEAGRNPLDAPRATAHEAIPGFWVVDFNGRRYPFGNAEDLARRVAARWESGEESTARYSSNAPDWQPVPWEDKHAATSNSSATEMAPHPDSTPEELASWRAYREQDHEDEDSVGPDAAELRRRRSGFQPTPQHERGE